MNYTEENTFEMSNNIKNAYNLMKQLKSEIDVNIDNTDSKEKVNEIINQVSEILEESTNEDIIISQNQYTQEKKVLLISSKTQTVILPYTINTSIYRRW